MYYFKWDRLAILDWFNRKKFWKNHLCSMTNTTKYLPLVETAGATNFAYIIWEEGQGNADEGLEALASIVVGKLFPDGRVIGLNDF